MNYFILHRYVWQIGTNEHEVSIFNGYSKEHGLEGEHEGFNSTRKKEILKFLKDEGFATKPQLETISDLCSQKQRGIVDCNGKYLGEY